jgi:electron transfer flavoprotein-quinone oxidoreductase
LAAEKFDAIVVGAGPAGTSTALSLARRGFSVLLIERGEFPGAKNMFGGIFYRWPLAELVPDFAQSAPIERFITEYRLMMLSADSAVTISYRDRSFASPPFNSFTVLRSKFDKWFASKAQEAGVLLANSVTVEDLIREDGRVVGVRSGPNKEDEAYADVVVAADGVTSNLAVKAGLRGPLRPDQVAMGVKEIVEMSPELIDSRFNVKRNAGIATTILGSTRGKMGGGFIYTNDNSVSVGIVILLSHLMDLKMEPYVILDEFENHPLISPMLEGGKRKEYSAHLIPEAGYDSRPRSYTDGLLLVGDAAFFCDLLYFECTNMAVASGMIAAEAIAKAKADRDFSAKSLRRYEQMLTSHYVMRELKKRRRVPSFFSHNSRLFGTYPTILNRAIRSILTVDGVSKEEKRTAILRQVRQDVGYAALLKDAWKMRALLP